ncbi:protein of unknown function [Hyphomicrobium sp. MC1]|nr:protein of unknown function [Hyphomicrobium sp. MC1]
MSPVVEGHHTAWHQIVSGRPMQNGESFNGRMRDELSESVFFGLDHARSIIAPGVEDYNTERPHYLLC